MKNVFRLDKNRSRQLTIGTIFIAYALSIFAVPTIWAGIALLTIPIIAPGQPELFELTSNYVLHSGLIAWCVGPVALPAAWWASRTGWVGWGTALSLGFIGAIGGVPAAWMFLQNDIGGDFSTFVAVHMPMGTSYGVAVWIMLRLLQPKVFTAD